MDHVSQESLNDLNLKRKAGYKKEEKSENFLKDLNYYLHEKEISEYQEFSIDHPFLFIFGLPRSGTTIISQIISQGLKNGYINNIAARFFLAPVHGVRLSNEIIRNNQISMFESDYARTNNIRDIHEFGYFWRYWLKKNTIQEILDYKEIEREINWKMLRKVLSNIQHEFDRPMVFKNIFGAYHIDRFIQSIPKVLFIYIERNEADVAKSILEARKKHYESINTWWSTIPLEYNDLKNLNPYKQIAGQVYYLKKFYNHQYDIFSHHILKVHYDNLIKNPNDVIDSVIERVKDLFNYNLDKSGIAFPNFEIRHYDDDPEKKRFKELINSFRIRDIG
ncbi:MAG TPA: sulfotransferase [Cyclobacteriaceae bacterium]